MSNETSAVGPAWRAQAAVLALAALACAAYANTLRNGFCWDDQFIVVENAQSLSLDRPAELLLAPDVLHKGQPTPYYRPLTRAWLVLDRHLFGLDPLPYHVENVLLHALGVVLLFLLARRLAGDPVPAAAAAALLAVHPIHAEAVNLVAARNNLLATAFVLGAGLAWLRGREPLRPGWLALSGVLFLLGLASKETALMLLPVLAARAALPLRGLAGRWRSAALALAPLFAAAAAFLALRTLALRGAAASAPTLEVAAGVARSVQLVPKYLALLAWPAGLTVHHAEPDAFAGAFTLLAAWAGIAAGVVWAVRARRPLLTFGLLWAVLNFVPVSTVVPIPSATFAERFAHLPAVGLWMIAGDRLGAAWAASARWRPYLAAAAAAVVLVLGVRTVQRNLEWHDNVALFTSAARVEPRSVDAANNLALALEASGDAAGSAREWARALQLDPANAAALVQLAGLSAGRGELAAARELLGRAVAASPRDAEARFDLALVLERTGDAPGALRAYEAFLALDPPDHAALVPRVRERAAALRAALGAAPGGSSPRTP